MYGLVKVLDNGQGGKIKLVGNALTFIIYKNYFGRDLLNDIVSFAKKNADASLVKKFSDMRIKTVEDLSKLNDDEQSELLSMVGGFKFDTEFTLNFIAALMATAKYPEKVDIIEIIMQIPTFWVVDNSVVIELMEFLSLFITAKKANQTGGGL